MEQTLVLIKPDALQRGLSGTIIARLESRGLKLVALKLMQVGSDLALQHYGEHAEKSFFKGLVEFITSSPIIAMVLEGNEAVAIVRSSMGETNPKNADPGTIRGDFALDMGRNLIHGSDSIDSARKEIALFFADTEILNYQRGTDPWITEL
ncbi:MAG: nucleoside-diphosphate kinase [SAR202 cluster bacterium Io17-Chloro-G3]|nr:MAG: nucleoside-diphosphate kinase [SAR202 cluster bacterium Io17-Chloro-G3]